jgi:UDPglucose 6-dehydrogenase
MDVRSAELTKYAANAMLAIRISFMNELAILADATGADIEHVRLGIGADRRIGYDFLYAGIGYGGSCFPKDIRALRTTANEHGVNLHLVSALDAVNDRQKRLVVDKILRRFGSDLTGRRIALWGLAFKPNTDDMRDAPSLEIVRGLIEHHATVVAFDPVAMNSAKAAFGDLAGLSYAATPIEAAKGSDALIIATEWREFKSPNFAALKSALKVPVIFDGRNLYDPEYVTSFGIEYHAIGRLTPGTQGSAQ